MKQVRAAPTANCFSRFVMNRPAMNRVVKQSSDLRTSNFKFEFVFVFQPFDIRIQASLIRHRWFCLESGAMLLQWCTVWRKFLCSLPAVNSRAGVCLPLPALPFLHIAAAFNYSLSCTAPLVCVVYWCKLSKWQILVAQTQSKHRQLTAIERNTAWRIGWLHCW